MISIEPGDSEDASLYQLYHRFVLVDICLFLPGAVPSCSVNHLCVPARVETLSGPSMGISLSL